MTVLANIEHIQFSSVAGVTLFHVYSDPVRQYCYYPHFAEVETEAQRGEVTVHGHTASKGWSGI